MRERLWANRKAVLSVSFTILVLLSVYAMLKLTLAERLASYLYSIPYNSVKFEMDNPRTHGGLYPDTLKWSRGGESMFGLQALIACNKTELEYLPTELVGVRAGIRNVSDSTIQLGFAYYSPNKHGIPPNYTLSIEGPHNYPRVIGYLGDDALYCGPRTKLQNMTSIPPGRVFNPSFDSLFYNSTDGLFRFGVPGTYRLWFTYSFDSLTSSLSIPLILISSDTIEFQVKSPDLMDANKLVKFFPKKLPNFEAGKPETRYLSLNPHWKESLTYPWVWKTYYRTGDNGDTSTIMMFLVDSGRMPAILRRHLCNQAEAADTTVKGYPACRASIHYPDRKLPRLLMSIVIELRIVVTIEEHGVEMEDLKKAANVIDYASIEKRIKR